MHFLRCLAAAVALTFTLHAAEEKIRLVRETDALTPEQERAGFHVPPGFEVQLFASEPQINKPINMAFDARGRLWVSSTVEYPYAADKGRWSDPQGTNVKGSRDAIKILEDTDGDGKADKVTDFANELNIPTGVLPWHKPEHKAGCIAWSIPNIWYFADTDGDDIADHREILFGPLGYEKDTHGMCSSFRLGLDGWVYATHGFNNTSHFKAKDGSTLELHSGNVFRFKPDGSRVEPWTHGQVNPFGLCWDRYGNLYSADCHSSPIYQLIRGAHYPSFGKPHDGLGFAPVMCQHTHGSTGICGIVYLDGGVWGPEWDDHTFVGNVVTSKVNHDHVTFTGSTPKANEQPDFLTSDDPWFRPVDLQLGPDNALYIADFYNKIIGHYEVPLDHPGRDKERGRIWRVVKKGNERPLNPLMTKLTDALQFATDSNTTLRHLAHQQLMTQHGPKPQILLSPTAPLEMTLWVSDPLNTERRESGKKAVHSYHLAKPQDQPTAIMMIQRLIEFGFSDDEQRKNFAASFANAVPQVRRWSFAALQAWPAIETLPHLLACERDLEPGDESLALTWRIAVREHLKLQGAFKLVTGEPSTGLLSVILAVPNQEAAQYLTQTLKDTPARYWEQSLSHIARHGDKDQLSRAITWARSKAPDSVLAVQSLSNGLSERGTPPPPELLAWAHELATQLLASLDKQQEPAWASLSSAETAPAWSLQPRKCSDGTEAQVLQSMIKGGGDEESRTGVLRSRNFAAPAKLALWINGHRGFPTAKAHNKNLVRIADAKSGETLASAFPPRSNDCRRVEFDLAKHENKQVRLEIVDGDDSKAYAWLGITRIEPPVIRVDDFKGDDATRASLKTLAVMLQHSAPAALREKLAGFLPPRPAPPPLPVSPEQRKQLDGLIVQRVAAFAKAKPDMAVGKNVFTMTCAVCHQIGGEGGLIGPQLDGIGARGVARLCEDILDPNRNVDAHFHLHTLTMKDGSTFSGFLKAELGQIHLLADATGKEHRIAKKDIAKTEVTPISLMPPTFGQTLDESMFIDLLGYLLNEKAGQ